MNTIVLRKLINLHYYLQICCLSSKFHCRFSIVEFALMRKMQKIFLCGLGILAITTITVAAPNRDGTLHPVANFFQRLRKVREQSINVTSDGDSTFKPNDDVGQPSTSSTPPPPSSGGSNSDLTTTTSTPGNLYVTKPPYSADVDRINNGVTTILNGVMTLDLAQILRGAFIFPKSHKVKSVANNVIDTIFGPAPVPLNGSSSTDNNAAVSQPKYSY